MLQFFFGGETGELKELKSWPLYSSIVIIPYIKYCNNVCNRELALSLCLGSRAERRRDTRCTGVDRWVDAEGLKWIDVGTIQSERRAVKRLPPLSSSNRRERERESKASESSTFSIKQTQDEETRERHRMRLNQMKLYLSRTQRRLRLYCVFVISSTRNSWEKLHLLASQERHTHCWFKQTRLLIPSTR